MKTEFDAEMTNRNPNEQEATDGNENPQIKLFEGVKDEIERLIRGGSAPVQLFAFDPAPEAPFREISLALDISDEEMQTSGCRRIIRLGSYWLVQEFLDRLRSFDPPCLVAGELAPFLDALREFSPDILTD